MEVDKLPSSSRSQTKDIGKVAPNRKIYPLARHGRTSSQDGIIVKQDFCPDTGRDDLVLASDTKEDKETRAVDYLLELSEGEDPNDRSFEERFGNVHLQPVLRKENKKAYNSSSSTSGGVLQNIIPSNTIIKSDQDLKATMDEKPHSNNSVEGSQILESKFVPYDKSFREENNSQEKVEKKVEQKEVIDEKKKKAEKAKAIRLSRLDRHERRIRLLKEAKELKEKQNQQEPLEVRSRTTDAAKKPPKAEKAPAEISEFAEESELPKKVMKPQQLIVKGTKGLAAPKEAKEVTYDMILMESVKDFRKRMNRSAAKNKGKLVLISEKRLLERKNSERSVDSPRKYANTSPIEDAVLMGRSVSYNKFETVASRNNNYGSKSPAGQLKRTDELPSARSHFNKKERDTSYSPKLTTENIQTEIMNEGSSTGEIEDEEKDDVLIDEGSEPDIPLSFEKKPFKAQSVAVAAAVEKNQIRVVPDLKLIRDHKFMKSVAMKKLGAEVYGRSVSLLRTYIEKEPITKENRIKEDLEDLYNKLSSRGAVSNSVNRSHQSHLPHFHQDSFVLPQRKLEFVRKLPKIHSLRLQQESTGSRIVRLNSERLKTNHSNSTNRILPNELLQPVPNLEKEFNDLKLLNDFKLVGSQVASGQHKERKHAKSFNQKRTAFFKEGYTYFPVKDVSSHAITEIENSHAKQGPVIAPLYSWDESNLSVGLRKHLQEKVM